MQVIEQDFRQAILRTFHISTNFSRNTNDLYINQAKLVGSLYEGGFFARFFKRQQKQPTTKNSADDSVNRAIDVDLELTIDKLPPEKRHCLGDVAKKPGFVTFDYSLDKCSIKHKEFTEDVQLEVLKDGKLKTNEVKRIVLDSNRLYEHDCPIRIIKFIFAYIYQTHAESVQVYDIHEEITKATTTFSLVTKVGDHPEMRFGIDIALTVETMWTPDVTIRWMRRPRNWTNLIAQLDEELRHSYVIFKTSNEEKNNSETNELRYSFAHLERAIVRLQNPTQRLIYAIFKTLIYRELLIGDLEDTMSSYIGKTVMLWLCDQHPPSDPLWDNDDHSILRVLHILFGEIQKAFSTGFLPYYFIPEINVIGHISSGVKGAALRKLQLLVNDIEGYLPLHTQSVLEICEPVLNLANKYCPVFVDVVAGKLHSPEVFGVLSKRPDLLFLLNDLSENSIGLNWEQFL